MTASPKSAAFQWDDPLLLEDQLSADERAVRDAARAYCQDKLAPRVLEAFRNETADPGIFREMGALGLLGPTIGEAYGGAGMNYVCYGLIAATVFSSVAIRATGSPPATVSNTKPTSSLARLPASTGAIAVTALSPSA